MLTTRDSIRKLAVRDARLKVNTYTTEIDVAIANELIAARGGYSSLGARLDAIESALDGDPGGGGDSMVSLLDKRFGFAEGTIGGEGGETVVVSNLDDSGPGSLRAAIESDEPRIVTFMPGLTGRIALQSGLLCGRRKTIDGRGADITYSGYGLYIFGKDEIIVSHLKGLNVDAAADVDAIKIQQDSDNIMIANCSFGYTRDGLIDMTNYVSNTPVRVTIRGCQFEYSDKVMLCADFDD